MRRELRLTVLVASLGLAASGAAWAIRAQPPAPAASAPSAAPASAQQPPPSEIPPGVPVIQAPPETSGADNGDDNEVKASAPAAHAEAKGPAPPPPAPPAPPPPALPVRSPAAVLQVLDKVTAETMRFAAPVGQRVRYKNLVFTVKACETTGFDDPSPQSSAYLVVDFQPVAVQGVQQAPAKEVFHGWMFADSPGLHPLQHPVYDAWLIACMAAAPPA